jgi:hypothetical protein
MHRTALSVLSLLASVITSFSASASTIYTPVNFSGQANFTWVAPQTDPNGTTAAYFPGGPVGSVTLGRIPFNILSNAAGFQAWNGHVAATGGNGTVSITMPVGVYGVTDVYTLINTYWGASGGSHTALVFTGSGGTTYTTQFVGSSDIRNWCCTGTINGTSTINVYSVASSPINGLPGYLDMQHIVLPAAFATQTLASIQLIDSGAPGLQRTVLNGVTVQSVGPGYEACLLYDATKAVRSGATIPIKLQLCDTSGANLSTSSIVLHATSMTQTSTNISGVIEDPGNANPDSDFRFDSTLGSTGGYIFNLKTTGLATGTYNLNFTVSGDSFIYAAPFQVK